MGIPTVVVIRPGMIEGHPNDLLYSTTILPLLCVKNPRLLDSRLESHLPKAREVILLARGQHPL